MKRIDVAIVSYQNTIPFLYGLEHSSIASDVNLTVCPPYQCAEMLARGEVQIALIPSVRLLDIKNISIITDYCISAEGSVRTVELFAHKSVESIRRIHLDTDSRTSVELLKLLLLQRWGVDVEFVPFQSAQNVGQDEGCMLIGDKVFEHEQTFPYRYDLAQEWIDFTKKPFVFAVWVATDDTPSDVIRQINSALEFGVDNISKAVDKYTPESRREDIYSYLTKNIKFNLTQEKLNGLSLFLSRVKEPSSPILE